MTIWNLDNAIIMVWLLIPTSSSALQLTFCITLLSAALAICITLLSAALAIASIKMHYIPSVAPKALL